MSSWWRKFLGGDIAYLAMYDRKLDAGEKAQVETYCADRFTLAIA